MASVLVGAFDLATSALRIVLTAEVMAGRRGREGKEMGGRVTAMGIEAQAGRRKPADTGVCLFNQMWPIADERLNSMSLFLAYDSIEAKLVCMCVLYMT